MRKKCSSDGEELLKLEAEGQEFAKYLRSLEQLIQTVKAKIQQTKMLVTCQRFVDLFLFGLIWQYSSNQKNIIKVGSKS